MEETQIGESATASVEAPKAQSPAQPEIINARYEIVGELGKGGMGAVFRAIDRHRDHREVALKRVRNDRNDPKTLATIRNEFLSLTEISHPNVAKVYDFGLESATQDIFFTSELVDGPDWMSLTKRLNLDTDEGLTSLLDTTAGVLRGLEFIHSRGFVHLDIKPDNILVGKGDSEGEDPSAGAKLIDFGLARREKRFGGKGIMGTTYYIAPETIVGARVDRRTDLYSLGVVLYQLTTGRLPFRGKTNLSVFKGHLEKVAIPPHERCVTLPRQLSTLIMCLIEKKPADRFQSALEVLDEISREFGKNYALETPATRKCYVQSACSSGREEVAEKLRLLFSEATKTELLGSDAGASQRIGTQDEVVAPVLPRGRFVLFRGEPGAGKRDVIEGLRFVVQTQGAAAMAIDCVDPETEDDALQLVRELVTYASLSGSEAKLSFGRDALELARRMKAPDQAGDGRDVGEVIDSVSAGLIAASRQCPFSLHFHDLHLASPLVRQLVLALVVRVSGDGGVGSRLLLSATTLDPVDTERTVLQELFQSEVFRHSILELRLERLDADGVGRVIARAFGDTEFPQRFRQRILEESDGNPAILAEILDFFLSRELIRRTVSGWSLDGEFHTTQIPGRVRSELKARVQSLPEAAFRLGVAFAVLRDDTELELASKLAGIDSSELEGAVEQLRAERLLQDRSEGDSKRVFTFVHSSARDLLYQTIDETERAAEHDRAGGIAEEFYASGEKHRSRKLAYHFLRAGNSEKGIEYGVQAANSFVEDFEPQRAIDVLEDVLRLAHTDNASLSRRISCQLADLRYQVGDYRFVVNSLEPILVEENSDLGAIEKSRVALSLARGYGHLGRYKKAAELTQLVVGLQQEEKDNDVLSELLLICAEIHARKGNLVESLRCCERLAAKLEDKPARELASRLSLLLAENHYRLDNQAIAATHCQEALRFADADRSHQYPDFNIYCLAKFYKYKGKLIKAAKQFELSAQVSRKLGASDRRADALLEAGKIYQWLERPQLALPVLKQAQATFKRNGNTPGAVEVLCSLGETHRLLGEYDEARRSLGVAFNTAEELSNHRAKAAALMSYAGLCLDAGDLENAGRYMTDAETSDFRISGYMELRLLELRFNLGVHTGEIGEAMEHAAKALVANGQGDDRVTTACLLAQRAMLQCRLGKRIDARRALVMLLEIARSYSFPLCEGRARLLEGMILTSEGKFSLAEKSFCQAAEVFRQEDCERELVQLYVEHGMLALMAEDYENAYLHFEEGFYLAKKLNLTYMKCRYYLAMGLLEMVIPQGQDSKAEERFRFAEQLAEQVPYVEVLWQIQYYLGKLYERSGRDREAEAYAAKSLAARRRTTDNIPLTYRQGYLKVAANDVLERLLERRSSDIVEESSVDLDQGASLI